MFDKVVEIISEKFGVDKNDVSKDSLILEDLGADSLDIVELTMSLEDEVGCEIPDDILETFKTVGDVVSYLESQS